MTITRAPGARRLKAFLKFSLMIGCIVFLATKVDWSQVKQSFAQVSFTVFLVGVLIESSAHFVDALRQWIWVRQPAQHAPFRSFVKARYFSSFVGNFLPSTLVSDFFRASYLSREVGQVAASWASTLMVRVIGLLATFLILVLGLNFRFAHIEVLGDSDAARLGWAAVTLAVPIAAFFLVLSSKFVQLIIRLGKRLSLPYLSRLEQFLLVLSSYRFKYGKIALTLVLSLLYQASTVVLVYWICVGFNLRPAFGDLLFLVPLISFIVMVPASYNGIGIQDASWVFMMQKLGYPVEALVSISILWHLIRISATLPGALLLLRPRVPRADDPSTAKTAPEQ